MNNSVKIGFKVYKNLSELSIGKLEHLLQLAQIEIDNYKKSISNYSPERMKTYGTPHLNRLCAERDTIKLVIDKKVKQ